MTKGEIRQYIRQKKTILAEYDCSKAANSVLEQLEVLPEFLNATNILCYHPLPDELSTIPIINKWKKIKNIFLPRVNGNILEILPYNENSLNTGSFKIKEPQGSNTIDLNLIDLIIVPAMAYDPKGNRTGRGKGYYDRLLQNTKAIKVGIIYDFQLLPNLPTDEHDISADIIITEKKTIICNQI